MGFFALMLSTSAARAQDAGALDDPGDDGAPTVALPDPPELELLVPDDLRVDAARFGPLLAVQADREEGGRIGGGALSTGFGVANVGLGLWLMLDEDLFGAIDVRAGVGAAAMGLGLISMAMGIYQMVVPGHAERRHARWRRALEGGLDARELGRFEGELRAEAEAARLLRTLEGVTGGATALAGVGVILATAFAPLDPLGLAQGYGIGGAMAVMGVINLLASLLGESQAEADWRAYQEGGGPGEEDPFQLSITPQVTPEGGGVQLRGTF